MQERNFAADAGDCEMFSKEQEEVTVSESAGRLLSHHA